MAKNTMADAVFQVLGGGVSTQMVVRGEAGAYTFLGTNDMTAGVSTWDVRVYANSNLPPNKVDFLNPLTITWSYKRLGESNEKFLSAGV